MFSKGRLDIISERKMKSIKVLIFVIVFVLAWIVAPAEAFVLGKTAAPVATGHFSAAGTQDQGNFYFQSEVLSIPDESFNPYRQTRPRNFSNLPKLFGSHSYFVRGSGARGHAGNYDNYTDLDTTPTETPEPSTLLLFGAGLAGVGIYRRFKK